MRAEVWGSVGGFVRGFVRGLCVDFFTLNLHANTQRKPMQNIHLVFTRDSPDIHPGVHPGIHPAGGEIHPVFTRGFTRGVTRIYTSRGGGDFAQHLNFPRALVEEFRHVHNVGRASFITHGEFAGTIA